MFGGVFRGRGRSIREQRTARDIVKTWLVRARLGPVPAGQLGKRQNRRWNWKGKLWVEADGARRQVPTFDVSAGGAGLLMPEQLEVGTVVRLQEDNESPVIEGRVTHVDGPTKRGLFRTGVRFVAPDSEGLADR